ncbi:hypothetical protein IQ265_06445 [Nodosilinea sp. LEGE 06152]|uniref:hypothetical protein n=1 Tax=Nodosilinea sp. LEGE 06152 TaxID=2777966 RepID=UPI00187F4367|nr:hypothetical protein [Nodosilinea sp. LEGE 06152]MBE9156469.1 hypothetical protein [Nodosilinea sp. LEGE 06152]
MTRTSMISAVVAAAIAFSMPAVAWGQVHPAVVNSSDIADTVLFNHHGGTHSGHHHGGCW